MIKLNEVITIKGTTYKRVNKTIAEKLYNEGIAVFCSPCKFNLFSDWATLFKSGNTSHYTFNRWINEVMYYNCNNEVGNYLNYYVIVK